MKGKLILTVEEAENNHDKWLEVRKLGIGGSDIAVIMGYKKYDSPYKLYCEKTGQVEPEDLSANESVHWGTVLESVVANEFTERTGKKLRKCGTLQDEEYPFFLANVDRLVVGEEVGLECKTANAFKKSEWEGDNVPDDYYCQCQWYMGITGYSTWWIACLIGGNHYEYKPIPRNESFIAEMREKAKDFWLNHVVPKVPVETDGTDATTETIDKQYPQSTATGTELPSRAAEIFNRLDTIAQTEKLLTEQKKQAQNELKLLLGESEVGTFADRKVTWKTSAGRVTIDAKALQKDLPEVYAKYAKQGKDYRIFKVY